MRRSFIPIMICLSVPLPVSVPALAKDAPQSVQVLPQDVKFATVPFAAGVEGAWLLGAPDKQGPYALRVRMAKDAKIPPHTHPDTRMVTVLSGELFAGQGEAIDEASGKLYPAGSFFTVPAGAVHYTWAKSGEVIYQESGVGPSPTVLLKK